MSQLRLLSIPLTFTCAYILTRECSAETTSRYCLGSLTIQILRSPWGSVDIAPWCRVIGVKLSLPTAGASGQWPYGWMGTGLSLGFKRIPWALRLLNVHHRRAGRILPICSIPEEVAWGSNDSPFNRLF